MPILSHSWARAQTTQTLNFVCRHFFPHIYLITCLTNIKNKIFNNEHFWKMAKLLLNSEQVCSQYCNVHSAVCLRGSDWETLWVGRPRCGFTVRCWDTRTTLQPTATLCTSSISEAWCRYWRERGLASSSQSLSSLTLKQPLVSSVDHLCVYDIELFFLLFLSLKRESDCWSMFKYSLVYE